MNLVANAFKYTGGAGSVAIAARVTAGSVEVRVADTGVGIAEKELPFVFERFYRGAEARACGIEGTGVGLSIVREIVAAHGGTVRLESREGRGTTAIVTLP
jgi:signal transduction histidine kinase